MSDMREALLSTRAELMTAESRVTYLQLLINGLENLLTLPASIAGVADADPCGGNVKGGPGCTCDPPFGKDAAAGEGIEPPTA